MIVSIDIGTSYSSMCILGPDGKAVPVAIGENGTIWGDKFSMPTAVYVEEDGTILVGQAAMRSRMRDPWRFKMEFKRNLGDPNPYIIGNRSFRVEELYTEIFIHMKNCIKNIYGEKIDHAFLTYPAAYGKDKKERLVAAAKAAGLFSVDLLEEPVAAAMSYYAGDVKEEQIILVYDFGGGTFDAALVKYENGLFRLLGQPGGLERCGGIDMDRLIYGDMVASVEPDILAAIQKNQQGYMIFSSVLFEGAEQVKHQLSGAKTSVASIPTGGLSSITYTLTREKFDQMIAPLVAETIQLCRNTLEWANVKESQLSAVLMVGGTSRIPLVQKMVQQFAKNVPVYFSQDMDLAVVQGVLSLDMEELKERIRIEKELAAERERRAKELEAERIRKEKALAEERAVKAAQVKRIVDILCYVNNTRVAQVRRENFQKAQQTRIIRILNTPLDKLACRIVIGDKTWDGTLCLFRSKLVFVRKGTKEELTIKTDTITKFRKGTIVVHCRQGKEQQETKYKFTKMKKEDRKSLQKYLEDNRANQKELADMAAEVARIEAEERERIRQEQRKVMINCSMDKKPGVLHLKDTEMVFMENDSKEEKRLPHCKINKITISKALKGQRAGRFWTGFLMLLIPVIVVMGMLLMEPDMEVVGIIIGYSLYIWFFCLVIFHAMRPAAVFTIEKETRITWFGRVKAVYATHAIDTIDKDQRKHLAKYLAKHLEKAGKLVRKN